MERKQLKKFSVATVGSFSVKCLHAAGSGTVLARQRRLNTPMQLDRAEENRSKKCLRICVHKQR